MAKATPIYRKHCAECGKAFEAKRSNARFHSQQCKQNFNNRRAKRGALLYDLLMINRNERAWAKLHKVWFLITRLAMYWREQDIAERAGRPSWQPPVDALQEAAWANATVVNRNAAGAKRG